MSYNFDELKPKDNLPRRLWAAMLIVFDIVVTTPLRWLAWNLWGRRQAVARLRELAGLVPKVQGPNAIEPQGPGVRSNVYVAGSPLAVEDAHLEYYGVQREPLPKPDTDDAGLN
jgi:hypothetical protein